MIQINQQKKWRVGFGLCVGISVFTIVIFANTVQAQNNLAMQKQQSNVVRISSASPKSIVLQVRKPSAIKLKGQGFNLIKGAQLSRDKQGRQRSAKLSISYNGSPTSGQLAVTLNEAIAKGNYYLWLTNGSQAVGQVPVTVTIGATSGTQSGASTGISNRDVAPIISQLTAPSRVNANQPFTVSFSTNDDKPNLNISLFYRMKGKTVRLRNEQINASKVTKKWQVSAPKEGGSFDLILRVVDSKMQRVEKTITNRTSFVPPTSNQNSRNVGSNTVGGNNNSSSRQGTGNSGGSQSSGVPFNPITVSSNQTLSMTGRAERAVAFVPITVSSNQTLSMTGRAERDTPFNPITVTSNQTLSMTGRRDN